MPLILLYWHSMEFYSWYDINKSSAYCYIAIFTCVFGLISQNNDFPASVSWISLIEELHRFCLFNKNSNFYIL